uniref:Uncharacterized protein n=1 Tax=Anguilla anguilla TaxID=7936 RepID=A0A0E9RA05_ANGAN
MIFQLSNLVSVSARARELGYLALGKRGALWAASQCRFSLT